MDCDRMVLIDNIWMPMGELPSLQTVDIKSEPIETSTKLTLVDEVKPVEIEVETLAIDERPYGLDKYPLVLTIWDYLNGKNARTMKQIRDAMRKTERITEEDLKTKLPAIEGYNEALKTVIQFGVGRGFLREVSEDTYEAIKEQ